MTCSLKSQHWKNRLKPLVVNQNMSWQDLVDTELMRDGRHLSAAAILGHDGSPRGQSETFPQMKSEEITAIVNDFNEPGDAPTGFDIGGENYWVLLREPGVVFHGRKDSGGVIIKKTAECLIFGIYDAPMTSAEASTVVERFSDYLISNGF